ncbi:MAG: GAF domain-containing protein [Polyangiales bacterium]
MSVLERVCAVQNALLLTEAPERGLFEQMLRHFVELTGSEYGFIGEVRVDDGRPWLRSRAVSDIAWDDATRALVARAGAEGLAFRNLDTLFGRVLRTGEVLMENDAARSPFASGVPRGHPPLRSFLGVPVRIGESFVGMVGLANRPGGYDPTMVSALAPLLGATSGLFYMLRIHEARRRAEADVARRLAFERLIVEASSLFIDAEPAAVDGVIDQALARVGGFVEADRSYLFVLADDPRRMSNTHEWCAEGVAPQREFLQQMLVEDFPWVFDVLGEGRNVAAARLDDLPAGASAFRASLASQQIQSVILVPILHDGRLRGFVGLDAVAAPRSWSDEDAALLRVLADDIGNLLRRTRAARSLAESEERFRLIASNVRHAFFLMTAAYDQVLYVSPPFESLWGIACAALYQNPRAWLPAVDPRHREEVERTLAFIAARETVSEYLIHRPDGTRRWVRVQTLPVRDERGVCVRVAGIVEDITEQRAAADALSQHRESLERAVRARTEALTAANAQLRDEVRARASAEERLRRSESALRGMVEALPVAAVIVDDRAVRFANGGASQLFRVRAGEDRAAMEALAGDLGDAIEDATLREVETRGGDGVQRTVKILARLMTFEGRPAQLVVGVDVTEQRRAARMLREHEQAVARLAHIGSMEGLASAVAHEINQPLSAIAMWVSGLLARAEREPVSHEETVRVLERVRAQALRAGELMRRLRGFTARGEVQRMPVEIDEVCGRAVAQLRAIATPSATPIQVGLGAAGRPVEGDPVQFEIVVTNLLRNALDACREAPVLRPVEITTRPVEGGVLVAVRDHGPGVPPALQGAIFEPMMSTKAGGMGIGLSIARSIVEAHRGRLTLRTPDDGGACFEVFLPAHTGGEDG